MYGGLDAPCREQLFEHRLPRVHVHLRGGRQHAVQIEQHGVIAGQVGQCSRAQNLLANDKGVSVTGSSSRRPAA